MSDADSTPRPDHTVRQTVEIVHEVGLHARPAAQFVKAAGGFDAQVTVRHGERTANAKSLLQVLKLEAGQGAEVVVEADGPEAEDAVATLIGMLRATEGAESAPAD